ncbi:MAG: tRNA uridine-5-carboxymethylaminomethyl(34) synthesis GTPase MnmE [Proteobacteria bacterium]|nr:tRNA uridine-5-carboxymethylaminomethyl(34) synthesis GTPase MnmE [Pseudomonadota bacterium]
MTDVSTIFALSSGRGRAGVAVIRVSGPAAGIVLDRMAAPRPASRRAAFRRIVHPQTGELLDAALVLFFAAPKSETGEDIAELQLHGSPAVVRAVLGALATIPACRLAEPGEFARRAFENGKIDLTAAEGLADLIDAETDAQRRQALAQAGGAFASACDGWREQLLEARALAEAAIDFADEGDVARNVMQEANANALVVSLGIERHLASANRGEIVRDGYRVVLAGPPNAGKSSLLNALVRRDVAIVSPEPGTTRDVLEVRLDLGGYAVIVADTAGLREAAGAIEQEGMRRALDRARAADLVLWLVDATDPRWTPALDLAKDAERLLVVLNKSDLHPSPANLPEGAVSISALTGAGLPDLIDAISRRVAEAVAFDDDSFPLALPTQARHRQALSDCHAALARFIEPLHPEPELAAEDLRLAADALGRITGRIDAEAVLGAIFGRFCIGK